MPGSSPIKALKGDKMMMAAKTAAMTRPFTPLDLNIIGNRAKAFQDAREKDGATPPPSSPPASSVFQSSPIAPSHVQALGFSPVKQQRPFPTSANSTRSIVLEQSETSLELTSAPCNKQNTLTSQVLGLVANPERDTDADAVPHLLFGSKSVSLVIGRSKPSGQPHRLGEHGSNAADDIPASMQGLGSKAILRVNLPNDARHVSRVHAIVEWIPFVARPASPKKPSVSSFTAKGSPIAARLASQNGSKSSSGTFIVRIVGQNGLIVDGKRRREGQVLRLTSGKSLIDFFGVKCRFAHVPSSTDRPVSPVKSSQARVQEWTQRVTSPIKGANRATPQSIQRSQPAEEIHNSSPPASSPPAMLALMSPSKHEAAPKRVSLVASSDLSAGEEEDEEDDITSSPTPVNRRSGGLVAGPLNIQQVRAGDSDQEMADNGRNALNDDEEEDDDDDESDDEDYVPAEPTSTRTTFTITRKPAVDLADDDDSSSLSDDSGLVDQQIGESRIATQPTVASTPVARKRTVTAGSHSRSRESSARPIVADALTESQTRMPPPAAALATFATPQRGRQARVPLHLHHSSAPLYRSCSRLLATACVNLPPHMICQVSCWRCCIPPHSHHKCIRGSTICSRHHSWPHAW